MNAVDDFRKEVEANISRLADSGPLHDQTLKWIEASGVGNYTYNFTFLGRPIIQFPQDMIALQELIWQVKPDLVIEMGIAHGGSLVMSAAMLALLDFSEAVENGNLLNPRASKRRVLGVDIDIREHNKTAIEQHPMSCLIDMIQGSSIEPAVVAAVHEYASDFERVLVCLDSNHTHDHVLAELEAYAALTSRDSYCCVFDTLIEDMPGDFYPDRPWGKGNNPKTAVWEYLARLNASPHIGIDGSILQFEIDKTLEHKLLITVARDGYLRRL